jgi:hypothetical protein
LNEELELDHLLKNLPHPPACLPACLLHCQKKLIAEEISKLGNLELGIHVPEDL